MNFWQKIWQTFTTISFKGRASKQEFIRFCIFKIILLIAAILLVQIPATLTGKISTDMQLAEFVPLVLYLAAANIIFLVIHLWATIVEITLTVRRFHDFNKSGWMVFLYWIIGIIILIIIVTSATVLAVIIFKTSKHNTKQISHILSQIGGYGLWLTILFICCIKNGSKEGNTYGEPPIEQKIFND